MRPKTPIPSVSPCISRVFPKHWCLTFPLGCLSSSGVPSAAQLCSGSPNTGTVPPLQHSRPVSGETLKTLAERCAGSNTEGEILTLGGTEKILNRVAVVLYCLVVVLGIVILCGFSNQIVRYLQMTVQKMTQLCGKWEMSEHNIIMLDHCTHNSFF